MMTIFPGACLNIFIDPVPGNIYMVFALLCCLGLGSVNCHLNIYR